jgi:hypothetical protein
VTPEQDDEVARAHDRALVLLDQAATLIRQARLEILHHCPGHGWRQFADEIEELARPIDIKYQIQRAESDKWWDKRSRKPRDE